jgi:hypothetical protein
VAAVIVGEDGIGRLLTVVVGAADDSLAWVSATLQLPALGENTIVAGWLLLLGATAIAALLVAVLGAGQAGDRSSRHNP